MAAGVSLDSIWSVEWSMFAVADLHLKGSPRPPCRSHTHTVITICWRRNLVKVVEPLSDTLLTSLARLGGNIWSCGLASSVCYRQWGGEARGGASWDVQPFMLLLTWPPNDASQEVCLSDFVCVAFRSVHLRCPMMLWCDSGSVTLPHRS